MNDLAALISAVAALVAAVTGLVKVLLDRQARPTNGGTAVTPDMPVRRYPAPWLVAAAGLGLLAVGVWVGPPLYRYVTSSNVTAQAPFESAKLYNFHRYYFDASECEKPGPEDAPVAYYLPHSELVKCDSLDQPYKGTFLCTNNNQDLLDNQTVFLKYAIDGTQQPVTGSPAGNNGAVDGVQVAYNHVNSNDARVYWDSEALLCAAELQTDGSNDVDAAIDYWHTGSS